MIATTSKIGGISVKLETITPDEGAKIMRNFAEVMGVKKFKIKQTKYCPIIAQLQRKIDKH